MTCWVLHLHNQRRLNEIEHTSNGNNSEISRPLRFNPPALAPRDARGTKGDGSDGKSVGGQILGHFWNL